MERLTKRYDGVTTYIGAANVYDSGQIAAEVDTAGVRELLERLGAYEDTGLTPEDLKRAFDEDAVLKLAGQVLGVEPSSLRETRPRWISVADRLPEKGVPVIVCREGGKVEQGARDVMDWWRVYGTRTKRVTHWMPLPEPPKEV